MKYIVYLTINKKCKVNDKYCIYIGVHKTLTENIFDGYLGCGVIANQPSTYMYPKSPFQYAVKKYGPKSFYRITLYEYDLEEDAYKKEKEIVNEQFLKQSHVYNVAIGGELENRYKPLYQFSFDGTLIKKWDSSKDAYDFYNYPSFKWDSAKRWKCAFLGYYWSTDETIDISDYTNKNSNTTYLYDLNCKLIKEFFCQFDCGKYLNFNSGGLSRAIKNESLVLKKYYVSTTLVDLFIPKPRKQYKNETFYVYYKDGSYIGSYKGKEVMSAINLHSWSKMSYIFTHNKNWYKDYYLSFEKINKVPSKVFSNSISISIYNLSGDLIEECPSIKYVKDKYKIPAHKLKNIQLGNKYYENYIIKYNSK